MTNSQKEQNEISLLRISLHFKSKAAVQDDLLGKEEESPQKNQKIIAGSHGHG